MILGLYYFSFTFNGLDSAFGAVIKRNGAPQAPEAVAGAGGGAVSTESLFVCAANDRVYVEVTSLGGQNSVVPTYGRNHSLTGFVGRLIYALETIAGL